MQLDENLMHMNGDKSLKLDLIILCQVIGSDINQLIQNCHIPCDQSVHF